MTQQPIMPKTLTREAPVFDNQSSLTAGPRVPVVLRDYWLLEKTAHFNRERVPDLRPQDLPTASTPTVPRPLGFLDFEATHFGAFAFLDRGNEQDFLTVSKQMVMSKNYTPAEIRVDGQMKTAVQLNPGDMYGYMTTFGSYGKFRVESVDPEVAISFLTYG